MLAHLATAATAVLGYHGEPWWDVEDLEAVVRVVAKVAAVLGGAGILMAIAFSVVVFSVASAAGPRPPRARPRSAGPRASAARAG